MNKWRKPFGDVKIKRAREYELDNAIADLENRGYELVRRGEEHKEVKRYNHEGNSIDRLSRFRYSDHQPISNYYAVMRKKEAVQT